VRTRAHSWLGLALQHAYAVTTAGDRQGRRQTNNAAANNRGINGFHRFVYEPLAKVRCADGLRPGPLTVAPGVLNASLPDLQLQYASNREGVSRP
jgi:hypothetical protein